MAKPPLPPRERLIETATRLFAAEGFHAVGVARLVREAGVSRDAMYRHFRSKEELVLSVLRRRDEVSRALIAREIDRRAPDPRGKLLALFDFLEVWFRQKDFTGCIFVNAAAEFHDADDPIHRQAAEHKRLMLAHLRTLCTAAGARDPRALAEQVYMMFDGAVVQAHMQGPSAARIEAARAAVALLIDSATAETGPDLRAAAG